jgi:hypothetical protein
VLLRRQIQGGLAACRTHDRKAFGLEQQSDKIRGAVVVLHHQRYALLEFRCGCRS